MAIGGPPASSPRGKDTSRGAAGRYVFVIEVARGYPGTLWIAYDPADTSERGTAFVRHIAPIAVTNVRAAVLEAVRWGQGAKLPNSPSALEVVEGKTSLDVVMAAPPGEVLRTLLRTIALKHVPTEPALLLGVARGLLNELQALHQHANATSSKHGFGGVHPDSVLIDAEGRVQLLDVGSAAAASAREPWHSDPQRMGYFAPEQLEVRASPDARTDVFAVGVILWEALTNRRLFPGNDAKTVRERLQKGPIARLDATRSSASPGIATPISDVIARALERDPAQRFQSADEMARALDALECADARRIGEWVAATADVAIAKRRQVIERARAGASLGGDSVAPPAPGGARTSQAPLAPKERSVAPGARKSIPPRPSLSTTPPPPTAASSAPAATTSRPPAPSNRPAPAGPTAVAAPVPAVTPPPPGVTPKPVPAAPSPTPKPPTAGTARPAASVPSSNPAPPAPTRPSVVPPRPGTPSVAPKAPPAATRAEPVAAEPPRREMDSVDRESLDASEDLAGEVEDDYSEVSHEVPQPDTPAAAEQPAPAEAAAPVAVAPAVLAPAVAASPEAAPAEAAAPAEPSKMTDVPAQEGTLESAEPPRSTKRPPELPPESVHPPADVLAGAAQSPSSPISISPARALTEPARDRGRPFRIGAAVVALAVGIAIGGIVVAKRRAANEAALKAAAEAALKATHAVSALPVVISAPVPDAPPSASAGTTSAAPTAAEATASSTPPPSEQAPPPEPAHEEPPPQATHVSEDKGSTSRSGTESEKRRSGSSHNVPNAGYKPGGI